MTWAAGEIWSKVRGNGASISTSLRLSPPEMPSVPTPPRHGIYTLPVWELSGHCGTLMEKTSPDILSMRLDATLAPVLPGREEARLR